MTDKDKIKFAIRYLKQGLKSKRTPPLYEELMNELGFVKKDKVNNLISVAEVRLANWQKYEEENKELKELVEKYRQAVDKCLHITFMGGGCEVNTIGQYATLVDGYLTDVEGLAKWKN